MAEQQDTEAVACGLLRQQFSDKVENLQPLAGGNFSRAFAFTANNRDYVIRLNSEAHAEESFAKDDYAWRHFASNALPIPAVIAVGRTDAGYFAISERAAGVNMDNISPRERRKLLPDILTKLDAIRRADVGGSQGYGAWGADGNGSHPTWREYLGAINENDSEGYYEDWHRLFDDSFLERDVYAAVYERMRELLVACPEERGLIHNDYWFMNIIANGNQITGVIDWANALYGDPLYDVARLSWGSAFPGWWYADGEAFLRERYGSAPNFAERMACYWCHIGLDDMRFYAKTRRRSTYELFRNRLLTLIEKQ